MLKSICPSINAPKESFGQDDNSIFMIQPLRFSSNLTVLKRAYKQGTVVDQSVLSMLSKLAVWPCPVASAMVVPVPSSNFQ